jgi:glycosyltransferase involved in cell wall biosynthesis
MKQVWILNHYAQQPGRPGGTRHYSLAKYLLSHGWQTHIIAASVELNTGYQRLKSEEASRLDYYGHVAFFWLRTPKYKGNGIGRIINMLTYTAKALMPSYTRNLPRPDIIIGSSVHPFAAWAGAILAKCYRVPFIFEVRDLWPQTLIDMGQISKNSLPAVLLRMLEKWLYSIADRILVVLPRAVDYIAPLGISADKIVWLPNGVDLIDFPDPPSSVYRHCFTLMYFGAHGNANGLDNMIQAMALLQQRTFTQPICLRLIGDGPLKPVLMKRACQLKLDNVFFEPPVPKKRIPTVAAEADAFVFSLVDAPVFRYGISSNKLFDFIVSSRPVLFCSNAINNPIHEANSGITVSPEDPVALADAIEQLLSMSPEKRHEMGKNGRRYVEKNHDYSVLAGKLAAVLEGVCPK